MSKTMDNQELALIKRDIVDVVNSKIDDLVQSGGLQLPVNYSAQNAMKSAFLVLQETVDKDKNLALTVCTQTSIANSLFDMVIQGLTPAKDQGYFLVYAGKLAWQRSYFGSMAIAKRVEPNIGDIVAVTIYEGDFVTYSIDKGKQTITGHEQEFGNTDNEILGAYAIVLDRDGEPIRTKIMTIDRIKQSWKQSKSRPVLENGKIKPNSVHEKFPADMCERTVINAVCKPIINSSNDQHLVQSANRTDEILPEITYNENGNKEFIDVESVAADEKEEEKAAPEQEESETEVEESPETETGKQTKTEPPPEEEDNSRYGY